MIRRLGVLVLAAGLAAAHLLFMLYLLRELELGETKATLYSDSSACRGVLG